MESYGDNAAVKEAEAVISKAKRKMLEQTRLAMTELYKSRVFATAMKEIDIFLVLNLINSDTVSTNLEELTDVLRRFGTAPSYDDLAKLCFTNYSKTELSMLSSGEVELKVYLTGTLKNLITQTGEKITTQSNADILAITRQTTQSRNDYIFLVNYLAPSKTNINVEYYGV